MAQTHTLSGPSGQRGRVIPKLPDLASRKEWQGLQHLARQGGGAKPRVPPESRVRLGDLALVLVGEVLLPGTIGQAFARILELAHVSGGEAREVRSEAVTEKEKDVTSVAVRLFKLSSETFLGKKKTKGEPQARVILRRSVLLPKDPTSETLPRATNAMERDTLRVHVCRLFFFSDALRFISTCAGPNHSDPEACYQCGRSGHRARFAHFALYSEFVDAFSSGVFSSSETAAVLRWDMEVEGAGVEEWVEVLPNSALRTCSISCDVVLFLFRCHAWSTECTNK